MRDIRELLKAKLEEKPEEEAPKVDLGRRKLLYKIEEACGESDLDPEKLLAAIEMVVKGLLGKSDESETEE
jgi:hypothetical protein